MSKALNKILTHPPGSIGLKLFGGDVESCALKVDSGAFFSDGESHFKIESGEIKNPDFLKELKTRSAVQMLPSDNPARLRFKISDQIEYENIMVGAKNIFIIPDHGERPDEWPPEVRQDSPPHPPSPRM